jgi:hypothetical protein
MLVLGVAAVFLPGLRDLDRPPAGAVGETDPAPRR